MSENDSFKEVPIHMADVDINTPPAQDSPQNIVNILNDDCIQLVLLKLKNVNDFWSAAKVCTRFQANAKACFPFRQVKFEYNHDCERRCDDFHSMNNNFMLFESAEYFLSLFGPRIKSIQCDFTSHILACIFEVDHRVNLQFISQYCGQTLAELEISGTQSNPNLRSPYQALKKLKLDAVSFSNIYASLLFPELQNLEMTCIGRPVEWFANHFPMLQHVKIHDIKKLTGEMFIQFQNRNPQLQSLHVSKCNFASSVWENIGNRLPNIVELSLEVIGSNITHLSTLRLLRKLQITENLHRIRSESKSFYLALVDNSQPIEELKVCGVDVELGEVLQRLSTIKVLHIIKTPKDILVDLVKHLPALEHLHLREDNQRLRFHLLIVQKILQNCKKLRKIDIFSHVIFDGTTDLTEYDAIVALTTGRVKLNFEYVPRYGREVTTEYKEMLETHFKERNNEWSRIEQRPNRMLINDLAGL